MRHHIEGIFNIVRWTDNDISHHKVHFLTLAIPFCNSLLSFLLINVTKPLYRGNSYACTLFPKLGSFLQAFRNCSRKAWYAARFFKTKSKTNPQAPISPFISVPNSLLWDKTYRSNKYSTVPK